MQSPEYPELPFVQPAAYGTGRDGRKVMCSVIHYTAGSERSTSAEDGAAYDQRRTDGTSCHFFHDSNSTVQCVLTSNRSNSAFSKGNRLGIHHELCGTQQTRAQWLDEASYGTLRQAARWVAEDCKKYGLPVRRLSVAETRAAWYTANSAGPRGIVGHADITLAYPEDGGDHMDPGTEFPWDVFLPMVAAYVGGATPSAAISGGDDVQMLVKASDGQHWLVDGMTRRRIAVADLPGVGNLQSHQAGLLGNLGNGGQVFLSSATSDQLDGWGVDLETRITAGVTAQVAAFAAADLARDSALAAVVNALAAGGTSLDTAAVLAAINTAAAAESAAVTALQAQITDLRHRLAAAERAEATALDA